MASNAVSVDRLTRFYALVRVVAGFIVLGITVRYATRLAVFDEGAQAGHAIAIAAWTLLAVPLIFGWYGRLAATLLTILGFLMITLGSAIFFNSHMYLCVLLLSLVALSDCDRWFALRPASGTPDTWPGNLMRFQASVVYLFAGLQKVNPDFLSGDALNYSFERATGPLAWLSSLLHGGSLVQPLALMVVALELSLAGLLWLPRLRPVVLGLVLPLHFGMLLVAHDWTEVMGIGLFACLMMALMTAHIDLSQALVVRAGPGFRLVPVLRRLDLLRSFRFEDAAAGFQTVLPGGRTLSGSAALQAAMAQLPGAMFVAPYLSLPPLRRLADRLLAAEEPAADKAALRAA